MGSFDFVPIGSVGASYVYLFPGSSDFLPVSSSDLLAILTLYLLAVLTYWQFCLSTCEKF